MGLVIDGEWSETVVVKQEVRSGIKSDGDVQEI
jgi:hypothetical protein